MIDHAILASLCGSSVEKTFFFRRTPHPRPLSPKRGEGRKREREKEGGLVVWWFARVPTTAAKADRLIRFPLHLTSYSYMLNA